MYKEKIIIALDVQDEKSYHFLVEELKGEATYVKVGMELYYSMGEKVLAKLKEQGFKVFLDLKLHDIPNTVYKSCKTLGKLGVDMLNVHAAGGIEMMKAAQEGFKEENAKGKLIGVTQLTSTSQEMMNTELCINGKINEIVFHYARNVKMAALDGVVCSALEVNELKEKLGQEFLCVTPGIRPKGSSQDDQVRIMTPSKAIAAGSDYLVIGRAITQASSPRQAFINIYKDLK